MQISLRYTTFTSNTFQYNERLLEFKKCIVPVVWLILCLWVCICNKFTSRPNMKNHKQQIWKIYVSLEYTFTPFLFFTLISGIFSHSCNIARAGSVFMVTATLSGSWNFTVAAMWNTTDTWLLSRSAWFSLDRPRSCCWRSASTEDTLSKLSLGTAENTCTKLRTYHLSVSHGVQFLC